MSGLFITVLNMSLTASYAIVFVMVIRLLLKKVPKVFSYALWGVVLLRLVLPFSFESVISLIPNPSNAIPQDIVSSQSPVIETGIGRVDDTANRLLQSTSAPSGDASEPNPVGAMMEAGAMIWLLGVAVLLGFSLVSYFRFKSRLSIAIRVRDNIYETDRIQGPFVLGFVKPRIYIPTGLTEVELDHILQHEQTHILRQDHLIKPIYMLAVVLHWFNPLAWLSYCLMVKDMEMSCDEHVIKRTESKVDYSKALLSLSIKPGLLMNPLSFGESNAKSRIKNVLGYKEPKVWASLVIVATVVLVSTVLLANPRIEIDVVSDFPGELSAALEGAWEQYRIEYNESRSFGRIVAWEQQNELHFVGFAQGNMRGVAAIEAVEGDVEVREIRTSRSSSWHVPVNQFSLSRFNFHSINAAGFWFDLSSFVHRAEAFLQVDGEDQVREYDIAGKGWILVFVRFEESPLREPRVIGYDANGHRVTP